MQVGPAWLLDHDLAFTRWSRNRNGGVLDVVASVGSATPGCLFRPDDAGWAALDHKEGVGGDAYERFDAWASLEDGSTVPVTTYKVREPRDEHVEPAPGYLDLVHKGRVACGLPTADLKEVARGARQANQVSSLFVYGTLMRGESRGAVLARYAPPCWILAEMFGRLVDSGAFPGLVLDGDALVQGEFVRLPEAALVEALAACDTIEGFSGWDNGSLFERRLFVAGFGNGRIRPAWTYVLADPSNAARLPGNDWRAHRGVREAFLADLVRAHVSGTDERSVARHIVGSTPTMMLDDGGSSLLPLADALGRGELSERRLAQTTRRWAVQLGRETQ